MFLKTEDCKWVGGHLICKVVLHLGKYGICKVSPDTSLVFNTNLQLFIWPC